MNDAIVGLMEKLVDYVDSTSFVYSTNYKPGVRTHPIPFFGNIATAEILTIGLNPSATEFDEGRWPDLIKPPELANQLLRYFEREPHPWFASWQRVLGLLGASYHTNAAHLDISPRATINAASVPDPALFRRMLQADIPWMLRFMDTAPRVKLILLAGSATKRLYINELLAKTLPEANAALEGSIKRPRGPGKVLHHGFVAGRRRIPSYFCSSSPSDRRNPHLLFERVQRDCRVLRGYLSEEVEDGMAVNHIGHRAVASSTSRT